MLDISRKPTDAKYYIIVTNIQRTTVVVYLIFKHTIQNSQNKATNNDYTPSAFTIPT